MLPLPTVATLLVAATASAFMAWVIGAGSSGATPFAPAVGANAISVLRATLVVGLLGLAGAVLQGANVSKAVGTGLVAGVALTPLAVIVGILTAAGLMAVGIRSGIPIATAFTITGAVVGAGLALGGRPVWWKYEQIAAIWVLAPVVDGVVAYALARGLADDRLPEQVAVPALAGLVGALVANLAFPSFGPPGESASLAVALAGRLALTGRLAPVAVTAAVAVVAAAVVALDVYRDERRGLKHFLLALGSLVAFSAGASQVGLAVGPLFPLLGDVAVPTVLVLAGGGVGLLVGSWTGAPRMIQSLAREYSSLGPRRSIAALLPSFGMAQLAVIVGVPVSFNAIIVSAIVGSGYAVGGGAGVSRAKLLRTVGAWAGSFVVAFAVGYGAVALAAAFSLA